MENIDKTTVDFIDSIVTHILHDYAHWQMRLPHTTPQYSCTYQIADGILRKMSLSKIRTSIINSLAGRIPDIDACEHGSNYLIVYIPWVSSSATESNAKTRPTQTVVPVEADSTKAIADWLDFTQRLVNRHSAADIRFTLDTFVARSHNGIPMGRSSGNKERDMILLNMLNTENALKANALCVLSISCVANNMASANITRLSGLNAADLTATVEVIVSHLRAALFN